MPINQLLDVADGWPAECKKWSIWENNLAIKGITKRNFSNAFLDKCTIV